MFFIKLKTGLFLSIIGSLVYCSHFKPLKNVIGLLYFFLCKPFILRNIPTAGICYYINGYCKQNYIHIGHHLPPFTVAVHLTFANRIKVCGCWKWNGGREWGNWKIGKMGGILSWPPIRGQCNYDSYRWGERGHSAIWPSMGGH